jgi:hypothetical protein
VTVPRLAFAARLMFTADETGKAHRVEVSITDPAGQEIGKRAVISRCRPPRRASNPLPLTSRYSST